MDNCGSQNKNWTLYPALAAMVNNSCTGLETITLKYFDAGHTYMSADFHKWEKQLSEGKNSKATGPSTNLFFKESHAQEDFKLADFLKTKFKKLVEDHAVSPQVSKFPGINEQRKKVIIDNLLHLMPENRRSFWINLQFTQQD